MISCNRAEINLKNVSVILLFPRKISIFSTMKLKSSQILVTRMHLLLNRHLLDSFIIYKVLGRKCTFFLAHNPTNTKSVINYIYFLSGATKLQLELKAPKAHANPFIIYRMTWKRKVLIPKLPVVSFRRGNLLIIN